MATSGSSIGSSSANAAPPAAARAAPSFVVRMQSPEDFPMIGRFADDDFDLSRVTTPGKEDWDMYYEDENLKEEVAPELLVKDAEYYKKKRKQRRTYRRKQHLLLESASNRNLFEARPVALDSAEEEYYAKIRKNWEGGLKKDGAQGNAQPAAQFRNVLLKFVKIEGSNQSEIHVIPVSDQYNFRKCIRQPDRLLDDIDAERAKEAESLKKRAQAFKRLLRSEEDGKDEEETKRSRPRDAASRGAEDGFSYALDRAMRKRAGKNAKKAAPTSFLTESGVDMDEVRESNYFFGNDSSVRYQDDEEDNIHEILKNDRSFEEREREDDFRLEAMDDLEQLSTDDEEDDDDDEDGTGGGAGKSELSAAERRRLEQERNEQLLEKQVLRGTENVSTDMLRQAEEHRRKLLEKNASMGIVVPGLSTSTSGATAASSTAAAAATVPLKSTQKRPREDGTDGGTEDANRSDPSAKVARARFAQDATSSVVEFETSAPSNAIANSSAAPQPQAVAPSSAASAGPVGSNILSEDVVRQYVINQGGRVGLERFVAHFSSVKEVYAAAIGSKKEANRL